MTIWRRNSHIARSLGGHLMSSSDCCSCVTGTDCGFFTVAGVDQRVLIANVRLVVSGYSSGVGLPGCLSFGNCCDLFNGTFDFDASHFHCPNTPGMNTQCNAGSISSSCITSFDCCTYERTTSSGVSCSGGSATSASILIDVGMAGDYWWVLLTGTGSPTSGDTVYYRSNSTLGSAAGAMGTHTLSMYTDLCAPYHSAACVQAATVSLTVT